MWVSDSDILGENAIEKLNSKLYSIRVSFLIHLGQDCRLNSI